MKVIAENNEYKLCYMPNMATMYHVYKSCKTSPSGDIGYELEVARGNVLTTKIKSYFTRAQIDSAKAKMHGMRYATRFK